MLKMHGTETYLIDIFLAVKTYDIYNSTVFEYWKKLAPKTMQQ